MTVGAITWSRFNEVWEREYIGRDAQGARIIASQIEDPCDDDDPRTCKVFEIEAVGVLCELSAEEFAGLQVRAITRSGRAGRAASRFMLRAGEQPPREAWMHRRISHHLVEVYLDDTVSYEIVGLR